MTNTTTERRTAALNANSALSLYRQTADGIEDAFSFAFALADLVTLTEIRPYRPALNDAMVEARYRSAPALDWHPSGDGCPACGEIVDYCQGHGRIGDPDGADVLADHATGSHGNCDSAAECQYGDAVEYPDMELQSDYSDGTLDDDALEYATRVMLRYSSWLNSPHGGHVDTY